MIHCCALEIGFIGTQAGELAFDAEGELAETLTLQSELIQKFTQEDSVYFIDDNVVKYVKQGENLVSIYQSTISY